MLCLKENRLKHKHNIILLKAKMCYVWWRANQQHEAVTEMLCVYPFKIQQDSTAAVISSLLMNRDQCKVFYRNNRHGFR